MKGYNGKIAVEPFTSTAVSSKNIGGFAIVEQKSNLTPLRVVYGNANIPDNSTVYVVGECCKQPWASKIHTVKDKKIILLPESFIELVESGV